MLRSKVYIIDEVHMVTKEAFNALLKTLEEPPSHVVFILATTELEKVPETIISRCQNFSFRKIPENILMKAIASIAKKEGVGIDEEASGLIALSAEGSFRDALGMLDQILSLGDKNKDRKITGAEAREFLSIPAREMTEDFVLSLVNKDTEKGLAIINKLVEQNMDINVFLKLILRDVRFMLLLRLSPNSSAQLKNILSEREFKFLEDNKNIPKSGELEKALAILLNIYGSRSQYLPQLPLEIAFIKIIGEK